MRKCRLADATKARPGPLTDPHSEPGSTRNSFRIFLMRLPPPIIGPHRSWTATRADSGVTCRCPPEPPEAPLPARRRRRARQWPPIASTSTVMLDRIALDPPIQTVVDQVVAEFGNAFADQDFRSMIRKGSSHD